MRTSFTVNNTSAAPLVGLALAVLPSVLAHGHIEAMTVDGVDVSEQLFHPNTDPFSPEPPARAGRAYNNGNGFVLDAQSSGIRCGDNEDGDDIPAANVIAVQSGVDIVLSWTEWPNSHVGPAITYMAACANNDCSTFEAGDSAVWFKVHEIAFDAENCGAGQAIGNEPSCWGGSSLVNKQDYTFQIPTALQSGQYIIRHELIALHEAQQPGGAQIYPECIQVDLTSSGTSLPVASDLVSFPGAYPDDDPGLTINVYQELDSYTCPGPAVWSGSSSESPAATEPAKGEESVEEEAEKPEKEEADAEASTTASSASVTATASQQATVTITQCAAENLHKRRLPKSPHY